MNIKRIEDFKKLKGGIEINTLEELISQLLNLFSVNSTSWSVGIESLNDLISLKKHDGSVLSNKIGMSILNWVDSKYNSEIFKDFSGSYSSEDQESKRLVFIMDLTIDTIFKIHYNTDVLSFLKSKLKTSSNEYELSEIKWLIHWINETKSNPKQKISDYILDQVLLKTNEYFELDFKTKRNPHLLCGLRESIREHKLCYSIDWCPKSEKHLSKVKRTGWVGAGALMVSKLYDRFEMMGSAPGVDWIHFFELEVQDLEEYFYLEVPFQKENILKLKSVIKCSTKELLKMINDDQKIIYTEKKYWNSHFPEFQEIADGLNEKEIDCKVEIKTRKKSY
ncbi:hypothetical protein [Aquimarina sp. 2201CG5-10]|uniref:hypothetical protein n=1 Tax=Aquimarina callyspongiae TaxID=3098150 RepID=UPI002AB32BC5|nr:hypothetical protein [Aquimarina sp. 2201CG5-10]MDY8135423.1 hypothetical protein [Aquimarina sp. 2201CG5-10]